MADPDDSPVIGVMKSDRKILDLNESEIKHFTKIRS